VLSGLIHASKGGERLAETSLGNLPAADLLEQRRDQIGSAAQADAKVQDSFDRADGDLDEEVIRAGERREG
jgi:hypothetical protein